MDEVKKVPPKAPPKAEDKPPAGLQDVLDEIKRKKEEKAPTTKTEMGKIFKKGGYVRAADGIAKKGKTRGKFV